ncbi:MAG: hypothetical protein ACRCYU_07140 [Nocardioides sp.]
MRRVVLHVGTPKTGTSHLQDVLFRNRRMLRSAGINYPGKRFDEHFLAALNLMRLPWGGLEHEAVGSWERLAGSARTWPGTTIVSHEIFAAATPEQIRRALDGLGDAEVHVVISVRDLARQIPAEWQETIKHRRTLSYAAFLAQIQDPARSSAVSSWFWSVQEVPAILARWSECLPPERVQVITVPRPGAPPEELWRRFSRAFGLDGLALAATTQRANPSLGAAETTLVRRINRRFNNMVEPADYRPLVRELLAHQTLSRRADSPRLALPPEVHPWASELNRHWVDEIRARGYRVIGDLDDWLVGPPAADFADPDRPRPRLVANAAVDAIGALLVESARLREVEARLLAEVAAARQENHPARRIAEGIVRSLEQNSAGRLALKIYRRGRARSSRSA